ARALEPRIASPAAWAEIHRRNEAESRGEESTAADARHRDDAVLEWLAQRLEHRARELRKLVEKKHASMGEADLPGPRHRPAADDRGRGCAVVRRPEGRRLDEPRARSERAGDGVDARHLERLLLGQRREDGREPPPEHRLARPGRTGKEEVVRPGRGELERPHAPLLATDVREVGEVGRRARIRRARRWDDLLLAAEVADRLRDVTHADGVDPGERRLARRVGRAQEPREPGARRTFGRCDRPADAADPAVEPELADARVLG